MQELIYEEENFVEGIPTCGANLQTPVIETDKYIDEVHYQIGNHLYIENAP